MQKWWCGFWTPYHPLKRFVFWWFGPPKTPLQGPRFFAKNGGLKRVKIKGLFRKFFMNFWKKSWFFQIFEKSIFDDFGKIIYGTKVEFWILKKGSFWTLFLIKIYGIYGTNIEKFFQKSSKNRKMSNFDQKIPPLFKRKNFLCAQFLVILPPKTPQKISGIT